MQTLPRWPAFGLDHINWSGFSIPSPLGFQMTSTPYPVKPTSTRNHRTAIRHAGLDRSAELSYCPLCRKTIVSLRASRSQPPPLIVRAWPDLNEVTGHQNEDEKVKWANDVQTSLDEAEGGQRKVVLCQGLWVVPRWQVSTSRSFLSLFTDKSLHAVLLKRGERFVTVVSKACTVQKRFEGPFCRAVARARVDCESLRKSPGWWKGSKVYPKSHLSLSGGWVGQVLPIKRPTPLSVTTPGNCNPPFLPSLPASSRPSWQVGWWLCGVVGGGGINDFLMTPHQGSSSVPRLTRRSPELPTHHCPAPVSKNSQSSSRISPVLFFLKRTHLKHSEWANMTVTLMLLRFILFGKFAEMSTKSKPFS